MCHPGLLLGGMGQGESFEDREQVVRAVREEVGPKITLVVQGVHSISEVILFRIHNL